MKVGKGLRDESFKRSLLKAYIQQFESKLTDQCGFEGGEWDVDYAFDDQVEKAMYWVASLRVFGEDVILPELYYPATWWQHFKARWYPKWLLKLAPIRYNCYMVEARALYPNLSAPRHQPYIDVTNTAHQRWGQDDD